MTQYIFLVITFQDKYELRFNMYKYKYIGNTLNLFSVVSLTAPSFSGKKLYYSTVPKNKYMNWIKIIKIQSQVFFNNVGFKINTFIWNMIFKYVCKLLILLIVYTPVTGFFTQYFGNMAHTHDIGNFSSVLIKIDEQFMTAIFQLFIWTH